MDAQKLIIDIILSRGLSPNTMFKNKDTAMNPK